MTVAESAPSPLVCAGRAALADGRHDPESIPCPRRSPVVPPWVNDGTGRPRPSTEADRDERARAAGWSVPPPPGKPMCPSCRKPDPELSRLARDLTRPAEADRTTTMKEN